MRYFREVRCPSKGDQEEIAHRMGLTTKNVKVSGDDYYMQPKMFMEIATTERFTTKFVEGIM